METEYIRKQDVERLIRDILTMNREEIWNERWWSYQDDVAKLLTEHNMDLWQVYYSKNREQVISERRALYKAWLEGGINGRPEVEVIQTWIVDQLAE